MIARVFDKADENFIRDEADKALETLKAADFMKWQRSFSVWKKYCVVSGWLEGFMFSQSLH